MSMWRNKTQSFPGVLSSKRVYIEVQSEILCRAQPLKPKQHMKKLLLITLWTISSWTIWGADTNKLVYPSHPAAGESIYNAKEVSIDLFGSASLSQDVLNNWSRQKIEDDARLGAGVGVNYFHTKNIGVGLEIYSEGAGHSLFDAGAINLLGRLPIGRSAFAPYGYAGIGYQFERSDVRFAQTGGGLEYRFNNKFGTFFDVRYVFTDGTPNYALGRLGIRICF